LFEDLREVILSSSKEELLELFFTTTLSDQYAVNVNCLDSFTHFHPGVKNLLDEYSGRFGLGDLELLISSDSLNDSSC